MNKLDIAQAKVDKAGNIGDTIKIQHNGLLGGAIFKILSDVYLDEEGSTKIKLELIDDLGNSEMRKHVKNGFSYQYNLEDSDAVITPHTIDPTKYWQVDGDLIYRLSEDDANTDEVRVSMVGGDRHNPEECNKLAEEIARFLNTTKF